MVDDVASLLLLLSRPWWRTRNCRADASPSRSTAWNSGSKSGCVSAPNPLLLLGEASPPDAMRAMDN